MNNAIGCIELNSIARGYQVADAMVKAANVSIVFHRTTCPGKFIVLVNGDIGAVRAAVEHGLQAGGGDVIDEAIISNIHPDVFLAISGTSEIPRGGALGVIETFSIAAVIEAADAAVKASDVQLMDIQLAMAIGGKGVVTLNGDVSAVQSAVEIACERVKDKGVLCNHCVIANPSPEILETSL
ncbi:BMC domain-containing protein [Photobacterium sp. DNB23_23_1]|uniref:BMC domain-containing protein n=1 Tax=Photobacterium pectinilyticum TaxID=2906793 RepID=A0ABT1N4I2_9GAMM|nr:BMC domain-containing protein [Photobacterium sp. ZSDE20]MCQ1059648.1 BMC domain-containing protein [Photobacterium sp. ZSDE20]MDD1825838.1 BMC domain-containing protein [Photobacterium sp. ZSDE20]